MGSQAFCALDFRCAFVRGVGKFITFIAGNRQWRRRSTLVDRKMAVFVKNTCLQQSLIGINAPCDNTYFVGGVVGSPRDDTFAESVRYVIGA